MLCRLLALALFALPTLAAAETVDVLYLKDGTTIRGEVLELRPDGAVKIRTGYGLEFVYPMSAVDHLGKQETAPVPSASSLNTGVRFHSIIAGVGLGLVYGATVVGSLTIGDGFWSTTIIPLVGPLITIIRVADSPGSRFLPGGLPLLIVSEALQAALFFCYCASFAIPPTRLHDDEPMALVIPKGNGVAFVGRF